MLHMEVYPALPTEAASIRKEVFMEEQGFVEEFDEIDHMTVGEYHTAARGQSKKLRLMNIINDCMRHASNRAEFIALMESEGYKVRWETSRRNITYTTPSGWQCRDRLLFGDKYLKEKMEYEFRIRRRS